MILPSLDSIRSISQGCELGRFPRYTLSLG